MIKKKNKKIADVTKSSKPDKSMELNLKVPLTGASFISVLLIALLTLIGYTGYLGVNSIWKFTHPKINVSTDSFRALAYIAKNQVIPPMPTPTFSTTVQPDAVAQTEFLNQVSLFKAEFRSKFPTSKLLQLSDNDVLSMGDSFCAAKEKSTSETGKYSAEEIISAHQAKFILQHPLMSGLDYYLAGVGQRAFDYLCRSN